MTTSPSVRVLIDEIIDIYHALSYLPELVPGPQVNALLTRLVNLCIEPYDSSFTAQIFETPGISTLYKHLRPMCAEAEAHLEMHWAQHIISTASPTVAQIPALHSKKGNGNGDAELGSPTSLLHAFPYYDNYIDLTRLEGSILEAFLPSYTSSTRPTAPRKILFIGCGPLPLTSICLLERYPETTIHNIDRDITALDTARKLAGVLGGSVEQRLTWACEDVGVSKTVKNCVAKKEDWRPFDVVFFAALVGMGTEEKVRMLELLAKRLTPGTLVVVRSARGLRGMLYPVFELSGELEKSGYDVLVELHPWTKVVNSVVVLRVQDSLSQTHPEYWW
ncbi:Nicotianamine synthase [Amniculicola lignicola CBS 123094]|uniref:Nicotianamine synthase n=1 Tax=Amniculicola lignicola CBS 123094 TaxID=1392246 RepID=A0A6A5WWU7_9PLEO|nr:Nicotianamine synthase [Amniculicola lignicola CBS 123094]